MRPSFRHDAERRPAIAAVELALVLVFLSAFVVGMIEMARGMMVRETLSDAARRGCRAAILPLGSNATITAEVNKVLADHHIKSSDATIQVLVNDETANASSAVQNDKIAVTVSVPVAKVGWITPMFLPGSSIESEKMVMMRQR